jgi:histidine triad (HIT) family protein
MQHNTNYDPGNIFAKIIRGEAPCFKVYEDAMTLAFMDIMPQAEGHTLVIPKFGARDLFDLPPDHLAPLMRSAQVVATAVKEAFSAPGIMIAQLNGKAAGQTVFHLHFHILPRFDGIDFRMHARDPADRGLLAAHAERIRTVLSAS